VGKAALAGLKGIEKVTRGFTDGHESNTVYYKPAVITLEEIEKALKASGTYIGTKKE